MTSKAPWKIVTLHHPVFNIGGHGTGWGHAAYLPLFHEAKVDLLLVGHSHLYERFRPIASQSGPNSWPITHITTGGGGAPLTTSYPHPALAARAITNHYVLIDATPTTLKGCTFTIQDTLIDSFELKKRKGLPPANYLAQVYPEDAMKLSFKVSTNLTPGLASAPSATSPAQVLFTLDVPTNAPHGIELQIDLAADSVPFYYLPEGPVHVAVNRTNKLVWTRIQATGRQKVTTQGSRRELSPPLMFQARVRTAQTETLAYGRKSRVSSTVSQAARKLEEKDPDDPD